MKKVIPNNSQLIPEQAELVFSGVFYSVYHWQQNLFDNSKATFEMLKRADTAVTIAATDDKVVVIEDEQPHLGKRVTIPGGRVEPKDESTLAAAQRETREETGLTFNNWRLIKVVQPSNEVEFFVHIYLASDLKEKGEMNLEAGERIKVKPLSFEEVKSMIMQDRGVLGQNRDIFQELNNIDDLLNLPEFIGQEVDR